jgi:hypothetical protein
MQCVRAEMLEGKADVSVRFGERLEPCEMLARQTAELLMHRSARRDRDAEIPCQAAEMGGERPAFSESLID